MKTNIKGHRELNNEDEEDKEKTIKEEERKAMTVCILLIAETQVASWRLSHLTSLLLH